MGTPQAQPNRGLAIYQNPLPRHNPNVNQVSIMSSTLKQVTHEYPLPTHFVRMIGIKLVYIATHIGRGGERAPLPRDTRAQKPTQAVHIQVSS